MSNVTRVSAMGAVGDQTNGSAGDLEARALGWAARSRGAVRWRPGGTLR